MIERRLRGVTRRLQRARDDLSIAEEQLLHFADESDDAHIRALVADDAGAVVDHTDAQRHTDAMARHRRELVETIARLEATQDDLLDQLTARRRSP
jgi:hypothetical protein